MLVASVQYKYMTPPQAAIEGKIIPVADTQGMKSIPIRVEDIYYLMEMCSDFYASSQLGLKVIETNYPFVTLWFLSWIHSKLLDTFSNNERLLELPSGGVEAPMNDLTTLESLVSYIAENYPSSKITMDINPNIYNNAIVSDCARALYYYLNLELFEPITCNTDSARHYVVTGDFFTITRYRVNGDNEVESYGEEKQFTTRNGIITFGYENPPLVGEVQRLNKSVWENDAPVNYFKRVTEFPSGDMQCSLQIVDNSPSGSATISDAYISLRYILKNNNAEEVASIYLLQKMEKSSSDRFSFTFCRQEIMQRLFASASLPWGESEWTTEQISPYHKAYIVAGEKIYIKRTNKYTALPPAWTWNPS